MEWALLFISCLISGITAQTPPTFQPYNETAAAMFAEEDKDGDGILSNNDTLAAFYKFDFNGDNIIERYEYVCFQIMDHPELGSFAHAIFDEYDNNNDSKLQESDLTHFYNQMDTNGDSLVDQAEFVDFWVQIFQKHERYLLHGHVHPAHNNKSCDRVQTPLTFQPYNETAAAMFAEEDKDGDGTLSTNGTLSAFYKFDFNGDNIIERHEYVCFQIMDHPEIGSFAHALFDEYDNNDDNKLQESDLTHFYNQMDANGDSLVDQAEFVDFWVKIFQKHERYLLHGHVHPAHNNKSCDRVQLSLTFQPYNETAAAMFSEEDKDGDGILSTNDTLSAFYKFDFNGDDIIERHEYVCFQIMDHPELGSFAHALFDEYDYNDDNKLQESDLTHFYNQMDTNGDSLVDQPEFVDFWVKIFQKHERYLLKGHVHPKHNNRSCDRVHVTFNFQPYDKYAEKMFLSEDRNGDGLLSLAESKESFEHYDTNGDKKISRIEYACFQRDIHVNLGDFAHALFDEYDSDGDDFLDNSDMESFYHKMDTDGNSSVGQVEFVAFWEKIFVKYEKYHKGGAHHHDNNHDCAHGN